MKRFVKNLFIFSILVILASGLAACKGSAPQTENEKSSASEQSKKYQINIVAINGPTGMGMAYLNKQSDEGRTAYKYTVSYASTPDEITGGLISGEIDIAAIPVNLAGVLYNKTGGEVLTFAVNTLGVLYIVENGATVESIMDLKDKRIVAGGQGSTPEYILRYILEKNGLTGETEIEFVSEHDEAAMALASGMTDLVMLPEPKVTATLTQSEGSKIALDLTEEWSRISDTQLVQGVLVVGKGFFDKCGEDAEKILNAFISEYKESVDFTVNSAEDASKIIAEYGIVPKAAIALKAIPNCNIVCLTNEEMEKSVLAMLNVLYEANPKSVGGSMPDSSMFYYIK